ncbi:MAG TPA: AmmeMemoRadiSam system protein B [Candidatus Omnitrophica bacterium]|nr:AmmeMemoRadiSam system protein B [Candidatus Omnitrophota bacterium]
MLRQPVVAGQFYPSRPEEIKKLISGFGLKKQIEREKAIACILPHAGYIYSGKVAAEVLSRIEVAPTCIILGPNHTGYGVPASIMKEGTWLTPFSSIDIDSELAGLLLKNSKYLEEDEKAHAYEHSIEVELPLIQAIARPEFSFVPIVLAHADNLVYKDISSAIALAVRTLKRDVTIIASSDMTHYESQKSANIKDKAAIEAILRLDTDELLAKIEDMGISMCGYMPAVVAIMAAKMLGATDARLISYQTSGDVTGDYSSVVGYAGITIQ